MIPAGYIWYNDTGRGVYGIMIPAGVYMVYILAGGIWYNDTGRVVVSIYGIMIPAGMCMV